MFPSFIEEKKQNSWVILEIQMGLDEDNNISWGDLAHTEMQITLISIGNDEI